eukprot:154459_1
MSTAQQSIIEKKRSELLRIKREKLQKRCRSLKLSAEGSKMDMIDRIINKLYIANQQYISISSDVNVGETWDKYDDLRLSDEDNNDEQKEDNTAVQLPSTLRALSVPLSTLKNKGSVVDMLMNGPFGSNPNHKSKNKKQGKQIQKSNTLTVK